METFSLMALTEIYAILFKKSNGICLLCLALGGRLEKVVASEGFL